MLSHIPSSSLSRSAYRSPLTMSSYGSMGGSSFDSGFGSSAGAAPAGPSRDDVMREVRLWRIHLSEAWIWSGWLWLEAVDVEEGRAQTAGGFTA